MARSSIKNRDRNLSALQQAFWNSWVNPALPQISNSFRPVERNESDEAMLESTQSNV